MSNLVDFVIKYKMHRISKYFKMKRTLQIHFNYRHGDFCVNCDKKEQ